MPGGRAIYAARRRVTAELRGRLTAPAYPRLVVFCGNSKGMHVDDIVAALQQA
jgi:hypothetical protein